jgi:hypothetical protein
MAVLASCQHGRSKTKRAYPKVDPLLILVRLAGIEPTTPWFVARYSILSH